MGLPKWLQMVGQLAPMVLKFTPLAPIADYVAAGIQEAEQIPGSLTGTEKLAHAVQIARTGIAATNAQAGRVIIDPALSDAAITKGIDTTIAVVNTVHAAHANDTPPPPVVSIPAAPPPA